MAVTGHEPPVGVAMEFSGKPPLTRRPAIHAAAGHSANSPQPRDLIPATNCGRRSVPPTLIPNAAIRGTGDRHGGRARGRGRAQRGPEVETVKAEDRGFGLLGPLVGNHLR